MTRASSPSPFWQGVSVVSKSPPSSQISTESSRGGGTASGAALVNTQKLLHSVELTGIDLSVPLSTLLRDVNETLKLYYLNPVIVAMLESSKPSSPTSSTEVPKESGFMSNIFRSILEFITPTRSNVSAHVHDWGMWESWGITYQRRACKTCGWAECESL